jgi:hypothetical protein
MHRDDQRLDLAEERSEYEAPTACDAGPAEEHTRGQNTYHIDNPVAPHGAMRTEIAGS